MSDEETAWRERGWDEPPRVTLCADGNWLATSRGLGVWGSSKSEAEAAHAQARLRRRALLRESSGD